VLRVILVRADGRELKSTAMLGHQEGYTSISSYVWFPFALFNY